MARDIGLAQRRHDVDQGEEKSALLLWPPAKVELFHGLTWLSNSSLADPDNLPARGLNAKLAPQRQPLNKLATGNRRRATELKPSFALLRENMYFAGILSPLIEASRYRVESR